MNSRCSKCILPESYPGIHFTGDGVCNYCAAAGRKWEHVDFSRRQSALKRLLDRHRGSVSPHDCVLGLSGGKDSCYAAYVLSRHGMSPLAVTFDNGLMTEKAWNNIRATVEALSLEHLIMETDRERMMAIYRHFLVNAGEFCAPCNVGIRAAWYRSAGERGIKLVVSGQSSRTEANSPHEFFSCSPGYFRNVASGFMSREEQRAFMYYGSQLTRAAWHFSQRFFYLALPDYMPWPEADFIPIIEKELNWQGSVGEQHTDCSMSDPKEYLKLKKFGVTEFAAKLSSLVRDGQLDRNAALEKAESHAAMLRSLDGDIREQMRGTFRITEEQLDRALAASHLPYLSKQDLLFTKAKGICRMLMR